MALTQIDDRGLKTPIDLLDNEVIRLGTGNDLQIYHDSTNSWINNSTGDLLIKSAGDDVIIEANDDILFRVLDSSNYYAKFIAGGAVELYNNNVKTFETQANGITVLGPEGGEAEVRLKADEGDDNADLWRLQATTGGDLLIQNYGGGAWDENIKCIANGGVKLYWDDSLKLDITSTGGTLTGNLTVTGEVIASDDINISADSKNLNIGASADLKLYHNGTYSYITNSTGFLEFRSADYIFDSSDGTATYMKLMGGNAVELYYNGSKKFETTNHGAKLTAGNDSYGLWVDCNDTSYTSVVLNVECDRNTTDETYSHIGCHRSGAASVFFVRDSGNVENINNSYGSTSDERLKENIVDAGSQWDDIKNLKVRKFNFKETTDPDKKTMIGLVAQEAEKVSPGLVSESKSMQGGVEGTYKTVKYSILYMKAIKALQEAITKIETLETKVAALEAK